MIRRVTLVIAFAVGLAPVDAAFACKYNVRDVGFVDIGARPYALRLRPGGAYDGAKLMAIAADVLADSNVRPEVVGPAGDARPTATLVHPDGRELPIPLDAADEQTLRGSLISVAHSSLRDELRQMLTQYHSVVLVVTGADEAANAAAKDAADRATLDTEAALRGLPKSIASGPIVRSLTPQNRDAERVLLWVLNIDPTGDRAHVVVLFGRLRTLGPPLTVPSTDAATLTGRMSYVGADCECQLDRSWMTGDMLPHVWSSDDEAAAAKSLGFDPGNPLVITEVRQILDRGPSTTRRLDRIGITRSVDPLLGYTETEITPTPPQAPPPHPPEPAASGRAAPPAAEIDTIDGRRGPPWLWVTLGVVVAACTIGGLLILARSRSRA